MIQMTWSSKAGADKEGSQMILYLVIFHVHLQKFSTTPIYHVVYFFYFYYFDSLNNCQTLANILLIVTVNPSHKLPQQFVF